MVLEPAREGSVQRHESFENETQRRRRERRRNWAHYITKNTYLRRKHCPPIMNACMSQLDYPSTETAIKREEEEPTTT